MSITYKNSYIICTTPRSGSTLLCDLLKSTRIAGNPDSFFMDDFYLEWAKYLGVSTTEWKHHTQFDLSYLKAILSEGTGESKVFGMRIQWQNLKKLIQRLSVFFPGKGTDSEILTHTFRTTHYIYLSRTDIVDQAISYHRAEQTGLWHIYSDGTERERLKKPSQAVYDKTAIKKIHTQLTQQNQDWKQWFKQHAITPIQVTYEDLSTNPQSTVADILVSLGLDPSYSKNIQPISSKLANQESQRWAIRFRSE